MWDLNHLKSVGGTPEKLKEKFEKDVLSDKNAKFRDLCWSRIRTGLQRSCSRARYYYAIDTAFDAAQAQTTITLVRGLIDKNFSTDKVLSAAMEFGLQSCLVPVVGANGLQMPLPAGCPNVCGDGKLYKLDLPTFFQVFIPLTAAYVKIRWAKLFNDRNVYPLYKYAPLTLTADNRMKCDIVTARVNQMTEQMNYRENDKQSILQELLYGKCFNFPTESWYREEQVIDGKKEVVKEGIRYAIPHPTRCFFDDSYQASTFNADIGCTFSGYWDLQKYGEVKAQSHLWNKDKITFGGGMEFFASPAWSVYQMLYPCVISFPNSMVMSPGIGVNDRTNNAFTYQSDQYDAAVVVTSLFMKVVPKEWDLFDYEYPVWMRVQMANDLTITYMEPLGYNPNCLFQYDADQNREMTTSLALETVPFQDMLSNLVTQKILSVKQNLAKAVFFNTDQLSDEDVSQVKNLGEKIYRTLTFLGYSATRNAQIGQVGGANAFSMVNFPQVPVDQIEGAIISLLGLMERVLGFSPQELGGAASHEQSATETQIIAANNSVRLEFTGASVDAGQNARKQMIYDGLLNYSKDEFWVEVAELSGQDKKTLERLGFDVEDGKDGLLGGRIKAQVKKLRLDGFSSQREGANRIQDSKIAQAMLQAWQVAFSNPLIVEQVGVKQMVETFNQMLVYAGLPPDFKLKIRDKSPEEQASAQQAQAQAEQDKLQIAQAISQLQQGQQQIAQQMQQQGQALAQGAQQMIEQNIAQFGHNLTQEVIAPINQKTNEIAQVTAQIASEVGKINQTDVQQAQAISTLATRLQQLVAIAASPSPEPPYAPASQIPPPAGPVGPVV
jgi:hypothetical protein